MAYLGLRLHGAPSVGQDLKVALGETIELVGSAASVVVLLRLFMSGSSLLFGASGIRHLEMVFEV